MDLHEHLERTLSSAKLQLSKLDYLYNFHHAQTNERMNHLIYILTIISAIFLPLNLVVGFFGMNTSGLPFSDGASGTNSVAIFMIYLSVIMFGVIYFVKKKI
jgi:magnesium transporter